MPQVVKLVNFGKSNSGLTTVGFTVLDSGGATQSPRTTSGVYELTAGSGIYGAFVSFPDEFNGSILWDTSGSAPKFAAEAYGFMAEGPISTGSFVQSGLDALANGVWDAISGSHQLPNTMGSLLITGSHTIVTGTFSVDPTPIVSGVWNAGASGFDAAGSMGYLQNLATVVSSTVDLIKQVEVGTWQITGSQIVFFTSGTLSEIARFNLADLSGNPINPNTSNPFQRNRI